MAGGSLPVLPVKDPDFLKAASQMSVMRLNSDKYKALGKTGMGIIIYSQSESKIPVQLENGKFMLKYVDGKSGAIKIINSNLSGGQTFELQVDKVSSGVYWFQKI